MKTLTCLLFAALAMPAATIEITVRGNDKQVVSTTTLQITAAALKALNDWRGAQVLTPAVAETKDAQGTLIPAVPAVLTYPTIDSLWRKIIGEFITANVLYDYHPAIIEQRRLRDVANSEEKRLLGDAVK
jgi:hypothetical protein